MVSSAACWASSPGPFECTNRGGRLTGPYLLPDNECVTFGPEAPESNVPIHTTFSDALKRPSVVVFLHLARTGARQEGSLDSVDSSILYVPAVAGAPTLCAILRLTPRGAFSESFRTPQPGLPRTGLLGSCRTNAPRSARSAAAHTRNDEDFQIYRAERKPSSSVLFPSPFFTHPNERPLVDQTTRNTYRSGIRLAVISSGPSGTKIRFPYI